MKAGIWNIGAQGQMNMGAVGATVISLSFPDYPSYVLLPMAVGGAVALGAVWAGVVGLVKGRLNVNEVVMTILLNFVALYIVKHLIEGGPLMGQAGRPESDRIPSPAIMAEIGTTGVPYTIFIAIALAFGVFYMFRRSKLGFEIETVGKNPSAAKKEGINIATISIVAMLIGGALAGMAGYHQSANVVGRLRSDLAPNWGFFAIVVGLLVNLNALGSIVGSFFISGLLVGTQTLQRVLGMSYGASEVFFGLLLFVMTSFQFLHKHRIVRKSR
jgi:simple sugar transport system permease protein